MSNKTAKNFFMVPPLEMEFAGFYQGLLRGVTSYQQLGNRLIRQGEQAHAFRQFYKVKEVGRMLSNIPIKSYQAIGHYFLAVAFNNKGNGDQDEARRLFELAAETAPMQYKGKAILSLGAVSFNTSDFDSALYYFKETLKMSKVSIASIEAIRGMALLNAIEGSHTQAIRSIESILPVIKHTPAHTYFDILNSYAVELGEVGRKDEARNVIRHVLASPFIHAYPEWKETAQELKEPNRLFVSVPSIEPEPVETEPIEAHHASEPEQAENVIAFPALKEAPLPRKPDRLTSQESAQLTPSEKREMILTALRSGAVIDSEYDKLMLMLGLLKASPADNILDLEDEAVLDDIAVIWSVQIGAEEFVGFLSALRDCDDSFRLKDILDRLIHKVYHETQDCGLNEAEWRLRVERRLPKK